MCGGPALTLFRSEELELLVCGLPHLDFEDLQAVARYDGGYNQQHPTIRAFWATLHAFSLPEKKLFLKFTTGSDRCCLLHSMQWQGCHNLDCPGDLGSDHFHVT